jgi:hypothetical protein
VKRIRRAVVAGALLLAITGPAPGAAQSGVVSVEEENFRAEPRGRILAELREGTTLRLGESRDRDQWREATLEAWIWGPSVDEQQRPVLDLIVNASGENLRAGPNGEQIGRALGGMRLERLETRGRWLRVRRTGWIWAASIRVTDDAPPADPPAPSEPDPAPARPAPARTAPEATFATTAGGTVVLDSPAGDTLAMVQPGASVEVIDREGDWTRVRIEGWTFAGSLVAGDGSGAEVLRDLPRDSLEADPDRYRGRVVEWTIQFIALQEAERFRTDFLEGEPFILARGPGDDPGFVYVAIPSDRLDGIGRLEPLGRIRVLARVRTPRSSLTGAPVLELIEIIRR